MTSISTEQARDIDKTTPAADSRPKVSLSDLKARHVGLYGKALEMGTELAEPGPTREEFLNEVDELLEQITDVSARVTSFDEYGWLNDAAIKWQVVFSSIFNLPRTIRVALPNKLLPPPPPSKALSEDELGYWIDRNAEFFAFMRIAKLDRLSSPEEQQADARKARVFLASEVLEGRINFASRISPNSYWRLEEEWLKEVKCLRAYFRWQRRIGGVDPVCEKEDYYEACEYFRQKLVTDQIKASLAEFEKPRQYIEDRYLTDGKLDRRKPGANLLVARKARRIWETTGETDVTRNWLDAEVYVRMFYESIVPAVMDDDLESVLTVLKAFQYSRAPENSFRVINCFETALAIYFLNHETIHNLWNESAKDPAPESSIHSKVGVESWPDDFQLPAECANSFWYVDGSIHFKGLMTEAQRRALLAHSQPEHSGPIEELFKQSRLIHRETTL